MILSKLSIISSVIFCIASLDLMASKRIDVYCGARDLFMGLRTIFELICGLQDLSYCHLNLLPCQVIKTLEGVFNIRPSNEFLQICFCLNLRAVKRKLRT